MSDIKQDDGYYVAKCALCGSDNLFVYSTLFESPLANNLFDNDKASESASKFPLGLAQCNECDHVQLSFAVNPEKLFTNYSYKTGFSTAFRMHFQQYADNVAEKYLSNAVKSNCNILDVGCNDGYLLDAFNAIGFTNTFGVEPAKNLYVELREKHKVFNSFFDLDFVKENKLEDSFDVITANNVFAHTRNLSGFARAASYSLKENGVFIFEVQYLKSLLEDNLFDMIYHEHTSYHHLSPLLKILPKYNLNVFDAEIVPTHGGSIRVFCSKAETKKSQSLLNLLSNESKLSTTEKTRAEIKEFYSRVCNLISIFSSEVKKSQENGILLWGYTAPAKATTWLASLHPTLRQNIQFVIDDSPLKQGMYIPGTSIPIYSSSFVKQKLNFDIQKFKANSLGIIFSWNILDSLLEKLCQENIGSGKYLVPLPEVRIVSNS